jgi:hypothetical protein
MPQDTGLSTRSRFLCVVTIVRTPRVQLIILIQQRIMGRHTRPPAPKSAKPYVHTTLPHVLSSDSLILILGQASRPTTRREGRQRPAQRAARAQRGMIDAAKLPRKQKRRSTQHTGARSVAYCMHGWDLGGGIGEKRAGFARTRRSLRMGWPGGGRGGADECATTAAQRSKQREPRGRQRNAAQRPSFLALANPRSLPRWSPILRKKETKSEGSLGPPEFGIARRDASKGAVLLRPVLRSGSNPNSCCACPWLFTLQ